MQKSETGRLVLTAIVSAGAMIAFQVAGKATRDALFLSNFPVTALPATRRYPSRLWHKFRNVGRIDSCRQRSTSLDDEHCLVVNALFLTDLPKMIVVFRRVFQ
jgi:hypothetical protein